MGGKNEAFILDIVKLGKNKKLDQLLVKLFTQKNTTVVGFGFGSDLAVFRKHCPNMKWVDHIPQFIDAQDYYKAVKPDFKDNGGCGLAKACEVMLGQKLCKQEQVSNWENRPLRYSQEHYAANDAFVLISLMNKLEAESKKKKLNHKELVKSIGLKPQESKKKEKAADEEAKGPEEKKQKPGKRDRQQDKDKKLKEEVANPDKIEHYQ